MKRKYLLISPVGDGAKVPMWNSEPGARLFDLALVYYGKQPGQWQADADYYAAATGFKYDLVAAQFGHLFAEWAKTYSHIAFWDDDIEADTRTVNRLFAYCERNDLALAQPALTPTSVGVWEKQLRQLPGSMFHRTKTVEIMCPVFRADAFAAFSRHFKGLKAGHGLDVWHWLTVAHNMGWIQDGKVGVVDFAPVGHYRPVGKSEFYKAGGAKTGAQEQQRWKAEHRLSRATPNDLLLYRDPMAPILGPNKKPMSTPIPNHPEYTKFTESERVSSRWEVLDRAVAKAPQGLVLEFGVHKGESIAYLKSRLSERTVVGFDSFEGNQEDWRDGFPQGSFSVGGTIPNVPGVEFVKGWFRDTVKNWLEDNTEPIALVHADADTYTSTWDFLLHLTPKRLADGAVIVFDEYYNYPGWDQHEVKAFLEWIENNGLTYEYICWNDCHEQVAVQVFKPKRTRRTKAEMEAAANGTEPTQTTLV